MIASRTVSPGTVTYMQQCSKKYATILLSLKQGYRGWGLQNAMRQLPSRTYGERCGCAALAERLLKAIRL